MGYIKGYFLYDKIRPVFHRYHFQTQLHTPVPQMKTGNVLKHETMANLFMGKEYPVLI